MSGRPGRTPPIVVLPSPGPGYSQANEAQFRQSVQRAIQDAMEFGARQRSVSETLASGNTDNYDLGEFVSTLRFTADGAGSTLTGLQGGWDGRRLLILNVGSGTLSLANQDAGSDAENRMLLVGGATVNLAQHRAMELEYDTTTGRWREVNQN